MPLSPEVASPVEPSCVLIVDDELDIRDTLREVVELAGCTAITAANGVEALALLRQRRPCLMILDLLMPRMTGIEMLEEMKQDPALASLPVVIATSAPHLAPRGVPVLQKPVSIPELFGWMARSCKCNERVSAPVS